MNHESLTNTKPVINTISYENILIKCLYFIVRYNIMKLYYNYIKKIVKIL